MKTLVITVCLIGAAFAIPNHSLKNQLKERKHSFLEKNNRRFPDTSESKEIKEYKRNNTENVQPIYDHSESREMERPQIDRTKDQIPNEQGYSIQNQLENKADYQNSQLDTFNIFSREYLRDLDTSERTTMSYNVSQTEANESLSHEDIDETENRDNGISEEYPSKEEDQVTLLRQISQGTQEVHSDSLERDAHEYNSSVHLFENDDMEQLSEEGNGGKILQRQPIGSDEDRQDIEPAEDRVNSNLDMEETSQNPSHVTLKDSGFYEGIQGIFANILEATFGGEKVNANSTENEDDVDVLQSKADSESDQHNREMEDAARSQSLYEAVFLDATNVNIKDKSVDAVESKDSMKLPEMRSQASRSDGAPVFQDNRNLADEGHEHLHIDGNAQQTQEGDGSADANETGEERRINTNGLINANAQIQEPINMTSLEEMIDSASESKENVTAFASLNYDAGGLMNQELKENMVDPCQDFHCKQGKICDLDEEGVPKCVCQDADSCPRTILLDQVCGTDNKTYDSECHLFATKCQLEGTKRGSQLHLDYKGSCKHIPPCSEYELAQFPLRMRDWLKNVLVQLYESDRGVTGFLTEKQRNKVKKIYQHEKRLMNGNHTLDLLLRDFEKNYRMYVYPVHWQFSQLDHHPADRRLSHSELALLRAPLVPMEHCITDFFKACNTDKNKYVSLKEWGLCFGLKEEDIRESLLF